MDNLEEGLTQEGTPTPEVDNSQELDEAEAKKAERRAQQEAGSKQEVDRVKQIAFDLAKKSAELDGSTLLDLHSKDPKLAKEVAKSFGYESVEDVRNFLEWDKQEEPDEDTKFKNRYAQERAKEIHQESLQEALWIIEKINDPELVEQAKEQFDFLSEGKTLTKSVAKKFADMATLYVSGDKIREWKFSETLAQLSSTWLSNSKKVSKKEPSYVLDASGNFVLDS